MAYKVPFGILKITDSSKQRLEKIVESDWVSEGRYVREFEEAFAQKFGWRYCIATSSGTDAGIVVWSAIRELEGLQFGGGEVLTPACAFVATANCLLAAGVTPEFGDIDLSTLNLDPMLAFGPQRLGVQFVATMGKPIPVDNIASALTENEWLVGDWCEAHGAGFIEDQSASSDAPPRTFTRSYYADQLCDASIYSFYAAHLVIGGEGGAICTNDGELAAMCRSVKSHGRPADGYFSFDRIGYNSKWTEPSAAIALGSLERFDEMFERRRLVRFKLLGALSHYEDELILYDDAPGEVICPHAFPIVLRDESTSIAPLYTSLEQAGVQCKTLFGSLPTQHKAFEFLGYKLGDFPVAERVGRTGLHFGCHELMTDEDVALIANTIGKFFHK